MVKGLDKLVGHAVVDVVQRENPVAQELVQIRALQFTNNEHLTIIFKDKKLPWRQRSLSGKRRSPPWRRTSEHLAGQSWTS
jgi:hypothetical protein